MDSPQAVRVTKGRGHSFPESRATRKAHEARGPIQCERLGAPPEGHRDAIHRGETYVRVTINRGRGRKEPRFVHVKLCPACAIAYGLAEPVS